MSIEGKSTDPITIERTFRLGEFRSLRVLVNSADANIHDLKVVAVKEVYATYVALFVHNMFKALLEGNDAQVTFWTEKLSKLDEIRNALISEE